MAPHRIFFYSLILLFPTQLGYHWWPTWTLILGRRIDYLSPTLFLTDILLVCVLTTWSWSSLLIYINFNKINKNKNNKDIKIFSFLKKHLQYVLFFCLFIFANVYVSINKPVAIYKWIKFFEMVLLGYYIYRTKPNELFVSLCMSVSAMYSSTLAILQFHAGHSIGGLFWFLGERTFHLDTPGIARMAVCLNQNQDCFLVLRPYATFPHPNVLGGFLVLVIIISLYYLVCKPAESIRFGKIFISKKTIHIFFIATILLNGLGTVLTFSRNAWLALVIGSYLIARIHGGIFRFRFLSNIQKNIRIVIFIALLYLGFLAFRYSVNSFQLRLESIEERIHLILSSVSMWKQSPIIGVGNGNFLELLPFFTVNRTVSFLQPVHSLYLMILVEGGLIGSCLFIWLVYRIYAGTLSGKGVIHKYRILVMLVLLLGLFDHYFITLQQGQLLMAIIFGLALSSQTVIKR